MCSIIFFLQMFSLIASLPVFVLVAIYYIRLKQKLVLWYGFFIFGVFSFILNGIIEEYFHIVNTTHLIGSSIILKIIYTLGLFGFFIGIPFFTHALFQIKSKIIIIFSMLFSIITGIYYLLTNNFFSNLFWILTLLITIYIL
ncbi:MAG: hypothetical protein JXR64_06190, partial [Spirochaetales bacterium]|nr:hypothetical protein [Spirochaetales bacterium]